MNNLITKPFTYVTSLSRDIIINAGVHVFYNYEEEEFEYEPLKELYESTYFHFTEHDTSAGGSRETRDVLHAFKLTCIPAVYFVVKNKVYKYFGPWDKDTIERLYERLEQE